MHKPVYSSLYTCLSIFVYLNQDERAHAVTFHRLSNYVTHSKTEDTSYKVHPDINLSQFTFEVYVGHKRWITPHYRRGWDPLKRVSQLMTAPSPFYFGFPWCRLWGRMRLQRWLEQLQVRREAQHFHQTAEEHVLKCLTFWMSYVKDIWWDKGFS